MIQWRRIDEFIGRNIAEVLDMNRRPTMQKVQIVVIQVAVTIYKTNNLQVSDTVVACYVPVEKSSINLRKIVQYLNKYNPREKFSGSRKWMGRNKIRYYRKSYDHSEIRV